MITKSIWINTIKSILHSFTELILGFSVFPSQSASKPFGKCYRSQCSTSYHFRCSPISFKSLPSRVRNAESVLFSLALLKLQKHLFYIKARVISKHVSQILSLICSKPSFILRTKSKVLSWPIKLHVTHYLILELPHVLTPLPILSCCNGFKHTKHVSTSGYCTLFLWMGCTDSLLLNSIVLSL